MSPTEKEIEAQAEIKEFFSKLGYDTEKQEDINRLAENLKFAEKARTDSEFFKKRFKWVIVTVALTAALAWVGTAAWNHFLSLVQRPPH